MASIQTESGWLLDGDETFCYLNHFLGGQAVMTLKIPASIWDGMCASFGRSRMAVETFGRKLEARVKPEGIQDREWMLNASSRKYVVVCYGNSDQSIVYATLKKKDFASLVAESSKSERRAA